MNLDELVEHWTLLKDERELVAGKRGPTRLGFALLLKFYTRSGRFPRGRAELPDEAVAFVARQVGVPASDLGFYEWAGSTIEYHRAQIRAPSRVPGVHASRTPTSSPSGWPPASRRPSGGPTGCARSCWPLPAERIEPPSAGRMRPDRPLGPAPGRTDAVSAGDAGGSVRTPARAWPTAGHGCRRRRGRRTRSRSAAGADQVGAREREPGVDADRDQQADAVRAVGLPAGLFADVAPKVVDGLAGARRGGVAVAPAPPSAAADR